MSSNSETSLALEYHNKTKHSYWSVRTAPHYLDWENKPSPFKVYPELDPIQLPRELVRTNVAAFEAIGFKAIELDSEAVPDLDRLAAILFFSAGVTRHKQYPGGEIFFRAAACAGALYPVETYVVTREIEGLGAGVYHFNPGDFSLRRLREGDFRSYVARSAGDEASLAAAPVILIYTAISWRSSWKYRARSYRYHFWDNGMIVANALALCKAHSLPAKLVMGFEDQAINKLIGIDGESELSLSLLAIGSDPGGSAGDGRETEVSEIDHRSIPLSSQQVDQPNIFNMHRASSFVDSAEAAIWRSVSHEETSQAPPGDIVVLASVLPESVPAITIEDVILRRASTRRFARKAIRSEELALLLNRAAETVPADFLTGAGMHLNDIYLIANRVEGLEQGAYFFNYRELR
ncbi:MAG TPA: SagB family peptide dehydrogenase, partial [Blastocatellia bacterium]|nr:SagB family peptide dehydrogenase [Blastocatellia bacterium]